METGVPSSPNPFEARVRSWLLQRPAVLWTAYAIGAAVGIGCFPLSSNFDHLLGPSKTWKIIVFVLICVIFHGLAFVLDHYLKLPGMLVPYRRQCKAIGVFVALLAIYVYTFFSGKGEEREQELEGHNKTPENKLGILSLAGFAVMSFALSIQTNHGFAGEVMKFFLDQFVEELTKIKWGWGLFGALFSLLLLILRSCKEKHAPGGGDDQIDDNNNTTSLRLREIRTDYWSQPPTEDLISLALGNLNEKDLELARKLRDPLTMYINDVTDEIPDELMNDHNFIKDNIQREVDALHSLVNQRQNSRNHIEMDNWLVMSYTESRKRFFFKCKSVLEPDRWEVQANRIKKWIKHCNIVLQIIIPNERVLCKQLFGEWPEIYRSCFRKFCFQVVKKDYFRRFIERDMPTLMTSPEVTLVFRTVRDLIVPEFRSLFPLDETMIAEMVDLQETVGEAIRDYYFRDNDFSPGIMIENRDAACVVHPITIQVMHRLCTAFGDRENIEQILRAYPNPIVRVWKGRYLISNYMDWNVKKLEASLEAASNTFDDFQLRGVFIMANVCHILKKAYEFGFELTMEDDWVKEQARKIQRCRDQYWVNRTQLLTFFNQRNGKATEDSVTDMLRSFGLRDFLEKHSYGYDGELEETMRDYFLPHCESFCKRFLALLKGNQEIQQRVTEDEEAPLIRHRGTEEDPERMPSMVPFKLNCHGSVYGDLGGSAGFGCVLRDSAGQWIRGSSGRVPANSIIRSELWAIWRGLMLALGEAGVRSVVCETDSSEVFKLVNPSSLPKEYAEIDIIQQIFELKQRPEWSVQFELIQRDANKVAGWLAKHGAQGEGDSEWLAAPSDDALKLLLQQDLEKARKGG